MSSVPPGCWAWKRMSRGSEEWHAVRRDAHTAARTSRAATAPVLQAPSHMVPIPQVLIAEPLFEIPLLARDDTEAHQEQRRHHRQQHPPRAEDQSEATGHQCLAEIVGIP